MNLDRHVPRRRFAAVALGLAAAAGLVLPAGTVAAPALAATPASGVAANAGHTVGLAPYYAQRPHWRSCERRELAGFRCATVRVPMDYRHPDGRRLSIVVSRRPATDRDHRLGALVVDPVGPGADVTPGLVAGRTMGRRYDLVGVAPRGDEPSTAVQCTRPGWQDNSWASLPSRPTDRQLARYVRQARAHERSCAALDDGLRPYVTSANIARDLDVVRGVLGRHRLSLMTSSQATVIGALYGTLFPARLDRLVLDSTLPPDLDWHRSQRAIDGSHRAAMRGFAAWAGARDDRYHLGRGAAAVRRTIDRTSARLSAHPVAGFTRSRYDDFASSGTMERPGWPAHATALHALARGRDPHVDTSYLDPPPRQPRYEGAIYAYTCETPWPRDVHRYLRAMRRARDTFPYGYGVGLAGPTNCAFLSYRPPEPPVPVTGRGLAGAMIVGSTDDRSVPYRYGVQMAERTGAGLLTVRGSWEHAPYLSGDNPCVNRAVDAYLLHRATPPHRASCAATDLPRLP